MGLQRFTKRKKKIPDCSFFFFFKSNFIHNGKHDTNRAWHITEWHMERKKKGQSNKNNTAAYYVYTIVVNMQIC